MSIYMRGLGKVKSMKAVTLMIVMLTLAGLVHAQSLYVLPDYKATPSPVQAWDILDTGQLACRHKTTIENTGNGAVSVAVDSLNEIIFITHFDSNKIQILDGMTVEEIGIVTVTGATDLAGLAYDHQRKLLYAIERDTPKLYILNWNATWKQLTPSANSPVLLEDAQGFGIALDETKDLLFVANSNEIVRRYDVRNWLQQTPIELSRKVTVLAIDSKNQLLYAGSASSSLLNCYLTQYDIVFEIERETNIWNSMYGAGGVAINDETGMVYITVFAPKGGGHNAIFAYNKQLEKVVHEYIGQNPTGIAISKGDDVGNDLGLDVDIVSGSGIADGQYYAYPGDTLIYNTRFQNRKDFPVTGLSVVNSLPAEVTYVRDIPVQGSTGIYDPATHSYKVVAPVFVPGEKRSYQLEVKVNENVAPNIIANHIVAATSNELTDIKDSVEFTTLYDFAPLGVNKYIIAGANQVDGVYYAEAGNDILYELEVRNNSNPWPVTGVSVVDTLPQELQFVRVESPGSAVYDPATHTLQYTLESLGAGAVDKLRFTVRIPENTPENTVVLNRMIADSEQTDTVSAQISFIVAPSYQDLSLTVKLMNVPEGSQPPVVSPGQPLIYQITTKNENLQQPLTDVVVSTQYSQGLNFVSAEPATGTQEGQSYSWSYPMLEPGQTVVSVLMLEVSQDVFGGTVLGLDVRARSAETSTVIVNQAVQTDVQPLIEAVSAINNAGEITLPGQQGCVVKGENFRYLIRVANTKNNAALNNITILNQLPPQVEFVSSEPNGVYNSNGHFLLLAIPSLASMEEQVLDIQVHVPETLSVGTVFQNRTTIDSLEFEQNEYLINMEVCEKVIEAVTTKTVYNATYPTNKIIVTMDLPSGIRLADIDRTKSFILFPGNVPEISGMTIVGGVDGAVRLKAFFEPGPVRDIAGPGTVTITMQGWLVSGARFAGSGNIYFPNE